MRLDRQKRLLLMEKSELNQKDLADKAGISRQTLSAVMNGELSSGTAGKDIQSPEISLNLKS